MKSKFSIVVKRQFFCVAAFATALLFISTAATAQTTDNSAVAKPKAILLAEWTEPESLASRRAKVSPVHGRSAVNQKIAATDRANRIERAATEIEFKKRFATFKPTLLEEQAFVLVNKARSSQKLEPLAWDLEMFYLARQHSQDMAELNYFGHAGGDGKMVDERAAEIGIRDWQSIGENIAFNQGFKTSVEIAVQSWVNSPSHKQNLLGKNWRRSGIGIAETPEGKFYITQVFRD